MGRDKLFKLKTNKRQMNSRGFEKKGCEQITRSRFIVKNILIALAISVFVLLIFMTNFNIFFMGNFATYNTAVEAVAFLVAWLFYGLVMGYLKAKGFVLFISLYWGISGLVYVLSIFLAPIGKFAILAISVFIITLAPTYGLRYFVHLGTHRYLYEVLCTTLSWVSGAIGYLVGYILKNPRGKNELV